MSQSPSPELESLLSHVESGTTLVLPADYGGSPAEAVRQLIRRGVRDLRIVGGPPSGYVSDLLVGAGCVASLEMPGVILGDFGLAQRFRSAVARGTIGVKDTTCPAFHASIAAARQGLPFMPIRGLIGSDVLANRPDWTVVDNPFAPGDSDSADPIVLIPAFSPDVALFHARLADREGNVWLGKNFEVRGIAQAAKKVLVTYENVYDGNLLD
ncbi:MAG: CoA transferase subunit A, partial [Actinomycetes bacterium]